MYGFSRLTNASNFYCGKWSDIGAIQFMGIDIRKSFEGNWPPIWDLERFMDNLWTGQLIFGTTLNINGKGNDYSVKDDVPDLGPAPKN